MVAENPDALKTSLHPRTMTYSQYDGLPGVRSSSLQHMLRSPAHYRYHLDNRTVDTEAFLLGRAVHAAVLEPREYLDQFVVCPEGDRRTTSWKKRHKAFQENAKTRTVLSARQAKLVNGMAKAITTDRVVRPWLQLAGKPEVVFQWQRHDIRCKARLDWICGARDNGVLIELKTDADANPANFARKAYNLGYHRQVGFYLWALEAAGWSLETTIALVVVVEKCPPHNVVVYQPTPEWIGWGQAEMDHALQRLKLCEESGNWPGYATSPVELEIPVWASR